MIAKGDVLIVRLSKQRSLGLAPCRRDERAREVLFADDAARDLARRA